VIADARQRVAVLMVAMTTATGSAAVARPHGLAARPVRPLTVVTCPRATPAPTPTFVMAHAEAAVDGDTALVAGFNRPVRYLCIDAPEISLPCAREAANANATLVAGRDVQLDRDRTDLDKYGRPLRYVFVEDPGTGRRELVNEELVRLGWARALKICPDVARCGNMDRLEAEARRAGRGCWADWRRAWPQLLQILYLPMAMRNARIADLPPAGTPRPPSLALDALQCFDNDDEYVRIANRGPVPVDLEGWSLVSLLETRQTYTFEPTSAYTRTVLDPGDAVCVHTGPEARPDAPPDLRWTRRNVWNDTDDGGNETCDIAYLLDRDGALIDDRACSDP
jgi:endonuclease YncB( thermonuclease family)